MSWIDLLKMSASSLKRRKLRTFLTVLGVVVGTASIVVMISLGLGMQESMYREVEQSGGMTNITVQGKEAGSSSIVMSTSGGSDEEEESKKYVTDDTIEELKKLDHVKSANPVFEMEANILSGKYIGYITLTGIPHDALEKKNIQLKTGGKLPTDKGKQLELVMGNGIITMFSEKNGNSSYWETGELPDIDFEKSQMFLILDQESYMNSQEGADTDTNGSDTSNDGTTQKAKIIPKKYVVSASGVVEGTPDSYNANSYSVYCDLNILKETLKKEFKGRVIPGQPSTKSGKPLKEFAYSSATVQADDMENVDAISNEIRNLGYNVTTNAEYIESMKAQFAMIQAVLGGIGAVSLFVAAIGIMNTMMMSIYERTKEIGVMKVLGCSLQNIKRLFLLEAAFIGFMGGVIGNALSFLMSFVINLLVGSGGGMGLNGNISYIPLWLVGVSMVFAILVGMIAGFFPALRAMKLSPLAAIRND